MKYICMDCSNNFDVAKNKQVPDATGQDGIWIVVCPNCESNHIKNKLDLFPVNLTQGDRKLLKMWYDTFIQKCTANKQATNDANLLTHYTTLISDAQILIKKLT